MKSNEPSANGIAATFPRRKSMLTPACRAFSLAISTSVRLMSRPVIRKPPSFASSMAKNPGPGATSSTSQPPADAPPRSSPDGGNLPCRSASCAIPPGEPSLHSCPLVRFPICRVHGLLLTKKPDTILTMQYLRNAGISCQHRLPKNRTGVTS